MGLNSYQTSVNAQASQHAPTPQSATSGQALKKQLALVASSNHPQAIAMIAGTVRNFPPANPDMMSDQDVRFFVPGTIFLAAWRKGNLNPNATVADTDITISVTHGAVVIKTRPWVVYGSLKHEKAVKALPIYSNGGHGMENLPPEKLAACIQILLPGDQEIYIPGIRNGQALRVADGFKPKPGCHIRVTETERIELAEPTQIIGHIDERSVKSLQTWIRIFEDMGMEKLEDQDPFFKKHGGRVPLPTSQGQIFRKAMRERSFAPLSFRRTRGRFDRQTD